jgi:hypothetical protein
MSLERRDEVRVKRRRGLTMGRGRGVSYLEPAAIRSSADSAAAASSRSGDPASRPRGPRDFISRRSPIGTPTLADAQVGARVGWRTDRRGFARARRALAEGDGPGHEVLQRPARWARKAAVGPDDAQAEHRMPGVRPAFVQNATAGAGVVQADLAHRAAG